MEEEKKYIEPLEGESYNNYIQRILNSRPNNKQDNVYMECHHIIPKCHGGENTQDNLIFLYAEEHFYAHKLLALENANDLKLTAAWWLMCNGANSSGQERPLYDAEEYAKAKENYARILSESLCGENNPFFGHTHSVEVKNILSQQRIGQNTGEDNPFYGHHHSEESRIKMSKAKKGKYIGEDSPRYGCHLSEETKQKLSNAHTGKKHTQESKEKMSHSRKGRKFSQEHRENLSKSLKGRTFSEETKEKLSATAKKRLSNPMLGKKHSKDTKDKIAEKNGTQVRCVETGKIYISFNEASRDTGANAACISGCVKGIYKQAGNLHWELIIDNNLQDKVE